MAKLSKSQLLAKQKQLTKGAWKNSKKKEAKAGFKPLPNGIENGVAKVIGGGFEQDKNGKPYYWVKFKVVAPAEHADLEHRKNYFLAPTKNQTAEQRMDKLSSDLQHCGVNVGEIEESELPDAIENIGDDDRYVEFRTWKGKATKDFPNPETMMFLNQYLEDYTPDEDGVTDEAEPEEEADESQDETEEEVEEEAEAEEEVEAEEEAEPEVPASKPSSKKPSTKSSKPTGKSSKASGKPSPKAEPTESAEEAEYEPQPNEVWNYKANPKAKAVEVKVIKVYPNQREVTVKRLDNDKILKEVSWDSLIGAEE
jgi:hypothetical protein